MFNATDGRDINFSDDSVSLISYLTAARLNTDFDQLNEQPKHLHMKKALKRNIFFNEHRIT